MIEEKLSLKQSATKLMTRCQQRVLGYTYVHVYMYILIYIYIHP